VRGIAYNCRMPDIDARRHSPAAERNAPPILAELQRLLPASGVMLEIASGTGQHAAHFAAGLPGWDWQPTDFDPAALPSIQAWCAGLARVRPPLRLDVLAQPWPAALPRPVDAVFCANMIHIAPWACTAALMQGAARLLSPQGLLVTYGPYLEDEVPTAPGNLAFDADLRGRDPAWGLRRVAAVAAEAGVAGLQMQQRVAMPANNLLLVWARDR
jgi:SAM-dependent methyltransferase